MKISLIIQYQAVEYQASITLGCIYLHARHWYLKGQISQKPNKMTIKFQTEVKIPAFEWKTGYKGKMMLIGSCFTENIGNKLSALKYPVDVNPFGILYNPV